VNNSLNPTIEITGEVKIPKVGRRFAEVHKLPDDAVYSLLEKLGHAKQSGRGYANYQVWKFIQGYVPNVGNSDNWQIIMRNGAGCFVARLATDEDDSEDWD